MRGQWKSFLDSRPIERTIQDLQFTQDILYRKWVQEWVQASIDGGEGLEDMSHVDMSSIFSEVKRIIDVKAE